MSNEAQEKLLEVFDFGRRYSSLLRNHHVAAAKEKIAAVEVLVKGVKRELRIIENTLSSIANSMSRDNPKISHYIIDDALGKENDDI